MFSFRLFSPSANRSGWLLFLWMPLILAACSPHRNLYPKLEQMARAGDFAAGAKFIEENKKKYNARNEVIYNVDLGVYYHLAGEYQKSNEVFERAERRMDELFTESISANVGAMVVNDNTLPYGGEDFEKVMVNIYRSLNYFMLGDKEAALVEARKVDDKLRYINTKYESGKKNQYTEDAFARMLMGTFYEAGATRDDLNDAYISNKKAADVYEKQFHKRYQLPTPLALKENLIATAGFMGSEESQEAKSRYPGVAAKSLDERRRLGTVYFVHYAGLGPIKREGYIQARMPDGVYTKLAFPVFVRRPYQVTGARVLVNGNLAAVLEDGEPVGQIAIENLDNRKGRIMAKAIARAVLKYQLGKQARKNNDDNPWVGLAADVYNAVSEQADLRGWETLPDKIQIGRLQLPPGKSRITIEYTTGGSKVVFTQELGEVELKGGQTRYFTLFSNY